MAYRSKHLHFPISLCICWTDLDICTTCNWPQLNISWACDQLVGQGGANSFQMSLAGIDWLSSISFFCPAFQLAGTCSYYDDNVGKRSVGFKSENRNVQVFWALRLGTSTQVFLLLSPSQIKSQGQLRSEV